MNKDCLICGVGGQGVVLASKLIAYAAMDKGFDVRTTETIGMAQRGGSVVSHVRMGRQIYSPFIPKNSADVLLAFEPAEAVRNLSYLKEGGTVIVNTKAVKPVTDTLSAGGYDGTEMTAYLKKRVSRPIIIDAENLCREAGSLKVLNMMLLGACIKSGALNLEMSDLEEEVRKRVKPAFVEMNIKALAAGAAAVK